MTSREDMLRDILVYAVNIAASLYGWNEKQKREALATYLEGVCKIEELSDQDRLNVANYTFLKHFHEGTLAEMFTPEPQNVWYIT